MKVVDIDPILISLKAIRDNGMGKKTALDEIEKLIINNSFEIDEREAES